MKYLFVLNHPAHFHLFKHSISTLLSNGHECKIIAREKDVLTNLLKKNNFEYVLLNEPGRGEKNIIIASVFNLIKKDVFVLRFIKSFRPAIMVGTDWSITNVGRLLSIPSVVFNEDDTNATPENKIFYPFAHTLVLPDCCDVGLWKKKRISYAGYHELAYLHPNNFSYDSGIVEQHINLQKPYIIIRLVRLTASHDVGKIGLGVELLREIVNIADGNFNLLISFEGNVLDEFQQYTFKFDPNIMHHFLAGAKLVIGDSQTMIAESSVLGTPSVRFNDFVGKLSYLEELESKYSLSFGYKTNQKEDFLLRVRELLNTTSINEDWQKKLNNLLNDKIDVSKFFVWFLENYPNSIQVVQQNPNYQFNFR